VLKKLNISIIDYLDIDYCEFKQYNNEIILTKKNLLSMQLGVGLSFLWDTFGIERMIEDKMVRSGFLGYNIDTDLSFKEQNFNIWVESFICLFKKNSEDTTMLLKGRNIC
jgi:hypothetical protein